MPIDFFYFGADMATVEQFSKTARISKLTKENIKEWWVAMSNGLLGGSPKEQNQGDNSNAQKADEGVKSEL
jgi:hypothetical protein